MFELTFTFENGESPVKISVSPEETLLEAARKANVAIDAPCSGNGSCGKCRVKLISGEVEGLQTSHISDEEYADGWRLSCCTYARSDVTVQVPDIASAYRSRMKTADLSTGEEVAIFEALLAGVKEAGIRLDNNYCAVDLALSEPTLEDTMPDNERLTWALEEATGCERIELPFYPMSRLPKALRDAEWKVRVLGEKKDGTFTVYDVTGQDDNAPMCGLAIDIGTTTVSAVLFDLKDGRLLSKASGGNGQIRYGADVINRIIEQGKPGGRKKLQDAIIKETLVPLIAEMCKDAKLSARRILRMCVASNTTMNHLFVGVDADPVRMEPYIPAFFHWDGLKAGDLGLPAHPNAPILLAPNIGSYVGGDITAGTFAGMIWNKDELSLFIDLGTNGEIVFGNRDFLMSCACSAGPAFEGGDISCGMRATDGAIESCVIDRDTMQPTFGIIGEAGQKPVGLCGSGIIDTIAELFRTGIINSKGLFVREGARVARDHHGTGRYILAFPEESATGREVALNEVDILNFIRAKGAIYSAIDTLLSAMDMDQSVIEGVYVAGGIGSGINMKNAVRIGMFPNVPLELFHYIGNSSQAGAYAMALSDEAAKKVEEVAKNMTYMELSTHPGYMDAFVAACFLPHTDASRFAGLED
jgi:uncharacterized 2Fe-2S/4Fe-4S cluster protein (DUF4445 family)